VADVNHQDNEGNNAFFWLIRNSPKNLMDVIHLLIENGINMNHVDKNGNNVLAHLVSNYSESDLVQIMKALIDKGVIFATKIFFST
jgi:ankyrin repeat protein